jgi:LmbE family N-acetylglucosaminyl deacetylase
MKKWLKILLSLNNLRKVLGFNTLYEALRFNEHLEIDGDLKFKNVLVLAPHPDDEIFGVGGTIKKLAGQGAFVAVVYFCDGAGGVPEGTNENNELKRTDPALVQIRKKEAEAAAKLLGISKQIFYSYPDGKLNSSQSAVNGVVDLLKNSEWDIIFLPSLWDNHPDHRSVGEIFYNSLKQKKVEFSKKFEIWFYEIWTPLLPNRIVLINKELELKKQAIATQQSQLKTRGYNQAILALNQYRSEMNNRAGFAEAFFATKPKIYLELFKKIP